MFEIKPAISLDNTKSISFPNIIDRTSIRTERQREFPNFDYTILQRPQRPGPSQKDSNQITDIADLFEGVLALRHGFARHNELGIFNGNPEFKDLYGLVKRGIADVKSLTPGLLKWAQSSELPIVVIASDFLRAVETAELISSALAQYVIRFDIRTELRERNPGILEGVAYQKILAQIGIATEADKNRQNRRSSHKKSDADKVPWQCKSKILESTSQRLLKMESNTAVSYRTTSLLREIFFEQRANPCRYLLVGHEFSLGPALSAFLSASKRVQWSPGLYWLNRHIPRSTVFSLNLASAERHYLDHEPLRI